MFIFEQLAEHAETQPNKVIITYNGNETTYGEFYQKAKNLAGFFQTKGFKKEDIIALYLKNADYFLISYYACQLGGFTVLPINIKLAAREVDYIFEHSGAKGIIYDDSIYRILDELITPLESFETCVEGGRGRI